MVDRLESRTLFAVGALDATFNGTGKRPVDFGGVLDELYDVAVQGDGKIVAVGSKGSTNTYGTGGDFAVVRLLDNGTPDPAFGANGVRLFDFNGDVERANAVAIQPDGQILVGGSRRAAGSSFWGDWVLLRLNASDGSLDSSFGAGTGRVVTGFGTDDQLYDLALQPDGKIVGGGLATSGANRLGLARYNTDGSLDTTFDGDGKVETYVNSNNSEAAAVAIQSDGKIVTTGTAASLGTGGGVKTLSICRFNPNGSFDTTLNGTGWVVDNLGVAFPNAVAVAPDGGYFVVASVGSSSTTTQLRKYTSTGARATFGSGGALTIGNGGMLGENVGLLVQGNGQVVVAGTTSSASNPYYGTTTIARVTPAGAFDTSFNGTGKLILPEGGNAANAAFDPQGRVVVVAAGPGSNGEVVRVSTEGVSSLAGRLMKDTDGDQTIEAGEPPLAGWTVYLDLDYDGVLDTGERRTTTDASGNYRFDGLHVTNPPGGYPIKPVMQAGYGSRLGSIQAVVGTAGTTFDVGDWEIFFGKSVSGLVFNDANTNGVQDAGEGGLSGFEIFFDANANLRFDAGEPTVLTNAQGQYTIAVPASGNLRMDWPITHRQTLPANDGGRFINFVAGQVQTNVHFGAVASTFTGTGAYEVDSRSVVFVFDRPVRTQNLQLTLTNLNTGQVVSLFNSNISFAEPNKLTFEPVIIGDPNSPALPDGNYHARLAAGSIRDGAYNLQPSDITFDFFSLKGDANRDQTVNDADYAILQANFGQASRKFTQGDFNYNGTVDATDRDLLFGRFGKTLLSTPGSVSGTVFNDANGNGAQDSGEAGVSGRTVYLDVTGDGSFDAGEPARTTTGSGNYTFSSMGPGTYAVREVVPAGWNQTAPSAAGGHAVALALGQTASGRNFGVTNLPTWLAAGSAASWNASTKTLTVTGAASIVADPGSDAPSVNASGAAAALTIAPADGRNVHLAGLNLSNGARATLESTGAARSSANHRVLILNVLAVDSTSKLDLADNALILKPPGAPGTAAADVETLVKRGFNGGDWLGSGLTSSAAGADSAGRTALGTVDNAELGRTNFAGVTGLTGNEIFVKYTYYGDADLSGVVDLDDFNQFLYGFQDPAASRTWLNGDFDFSGTINLDDFNQFLYGMQNQLTPL